MNLFQQGQFQLHSGEQSDWKIECDALVDGDLEMIAKLLAERLPPFRAVRGIPRGGLRLAVYLERYVQPGAPNRLLVDDVLTTGRSMEQARIAAGDDVIGAVIFARSESVPRWVTALFTIAPIRNVGATNDEEPA